MLKMLLDPMGGIVLTNDGHAILREIEVSHPAAKSMIELSRTQDEEVGDGTTTVIILGMRYITDGNFGPQLMFNSWRDPRASPSTVRAKYPPRCNHLRLQGRSERRPRDHRRDFPPC
jgi:hypothetical protein